MTKGKHQYYSDEVVFANIIVVMRFSSFLIYFWLNAWITYKNSPISLFYSNFS
jgi:hypothetical protein